MNYGKEDKVKILEAIEQKRQSILNEQDVHREILEKPSVEEKISIDNLLKLGWSGLVKLLEHQYYPVDEEFMKLCLIDSKGRKTAAEQKIQLIEDWDIHFAVHHMNAYAEHLKRIEIMATIHRLFGSIEENSIFSGWCLYSQSSLLKEEISDKNEFSLSKQGAFKVDRYQELGQSIVESTIKSLTEAKSK